MNSADVIVIGGGICGLGVASFLSAAHRVIVLERESQPAFHASGRSAALFIRGYEGPAVSRLTAASEAFLRTPPEVFETGPLLSARGGLTLAEPGMEDRMEAFLARWRDLCPNLAAVAPEQALEQVPVLRPERIVAAAYDPDWYAIDVHALVMGYRRGLMRRGARLVCGAAVSAIVRHRDHWTVTAGERFLAPVLVNAAGAWAGAVGQLAGLGDVPLQPMRRTAVLLPLPAGGASWPSVHTLADDLYFKPEGNGLMLSPEDETPSAACDAQPEELDVARAVDHFQRLTQVPVRRLQATWAGLRTFAPDRLPVIGPDPRDAGFVWYAGTGGFGVQTSPGLASIVAGCIDGGRIDPDIDVGRLIAAG